MANALYNPAKQAMLSAALDMANDAIKATLIDTADYTFDAGHNEYSGGSADVPSGAKVAESAALEGASVVNGVFDSNDFVWSSVSGDQSEAIILWDDDIANDLPIAYYDTGITGMPITPNGGNINVTVNASGWFSL